MTRKHRLEVLPLFEEILESKKEDTGYTIAGEVSFSAEKYSWGIALGHEHLSILSLSEGDKIRIPTQDLAVFISAIMYIIKQNDIEV